jgi:hypothetical protein
VHFCKGNQLTVSTAQHSNVRAVPNPSEKRALHAAGFASQRASEQADKAPPPGAYGVPCVRDRYRARSHAPSSAHARDPSRRPSVSCSCSHPVSASTAWGSWAPVLIGAGSLATTLYGYGVRLPGARRAGASALAFARAGRWQGCPARALLVSSPPAADGRTRE